MVGDPRQLPSIVHSDSRDARQFLGRSIFEVTVPEPEKSDVVAMLDVQYRMHPQIGQLVSELTDPFPLMLPMALKGGGFSKEICGVFGAHFLDDGFPAFANDLIYYSWI